MLDHIPISRGEEVELLVKYIAYDPKEAKKKCHSMRDAHVRFSYNQGVSVVFGEHHYFQ
jgi:hypothetical protein